MSDARKYRPELSMPDRPAPDPTGELPRGPGLRLQSVAESTTPSRTPVFAQTLSYRKRQFIQRDLRSRTNARGRTR